jgi:DNA-binding Lrp family transcriptional regulator
MRAFVLIKVHAGEVPEVVRNLRTVEGVVEAHMTLGPYDAIAVIDVADVAGLGAITARKIQPIPGVEQTLTCLSVEV